MGSITLHYNELTQKLAGLLDVNEELKQRFETSNQNQPAGCERGARAAEKDSRRYVSQVNVCYCASIHGCCCLRTPKKLDNNPRLEHNPS
jgi:hypothetical protein